MRTSLCKYLLVTTLAALLSACITDRDACVPDPSRQGEWQLNLNIRTASLATRSQTNGTDHKTDNTATPAENYINIEDEDYGIFILDGKNNILQRIEPDIFKSIENGYTKYNLTGKFLPTTDAIKLMVLANWGSFNGDYESFFTTAEKQNLRDIYNNDINIFTYQGVSENGLLTSWTPYIHTTDATAPKTRAIPMFGISDKIQIYPDGSIASGNTGIFNPELDIEDFQMLRALAKIEIVDKIVKKTENDDITIKSCKLTAYNSKGRFIPNIFVDENADWDDPNIQVSKPSLPNVYDSEQLDGKELSFVSLDGGKTFVAYIPEIDLDKIKNAKGTGAIPQVELMVTANGNDYGPFLIDLGEYKTDDGTFSGTYYPALLRNHNYRFNINSVKVGVTGELTLLIDTDKWDNDEDEYYYEDLEAEFSPDGKFKWNWDYDNIDSQDPAFLKHPGLTYEDVKGWSQEQLQSWEGHNLIVQRSGGSGAEATFTLAKPERGTWTLALYCEEGTPKHWFQIEIWDKDKGEWILQDQRIDEENEHNLIADTLSGTIAGKGEESSEVKIRISATDLQYSGNVYKARLVMNVTTFDGRMAEIDLINGQMYSSNTPDTEKEYFNILQYSTATE